MNKFKLGEFVVLKDDLIENYEYGTLHYFSEMKDYFKEPRKIEFSDESDKTYKVHGSPFWYSEEMFELAPKYAVFAMYPNGLATMCLYDTKNQARCAKYYKLHHNDYRSRQYGRPIAIEVVECTKETSDNKFDEFFNKYDPKPIIKITGFTKV